jgi:hypothetical protein
MDQIEWSLRLAAWAGYAALPISHAVRLALPMAPHSIRRLRRQSELLMFCALFTAASMHDSPQYELHES